MKSKTYSIVALSLSLACIMAAPTSAEAGRREHIAFPLVRPEALPATCVPDAKGYVVVQEGKNAEVMDIKITGLPANVEFDVFLIQVPNPPFGLSWYQGDIQTKYYGNGTARFVGRFNEETFIVAPGVAPAPQVHDGQFPDAEENPKTAPVHTYHIGIWFNSPEDAAAAGCPGFTTPFNGEHTAGLQILNTSNYPDQEGPLLKLKP